MKRTILLCGQMDDPPFTAVHRALLEIDCEPIVLDRRAALEAEIELVTSAGVAGFLRWRGKSLDLSEISSVYLRSLASGSESQASSAHLQILQDILYAWADLVPALILNRPTPMAANDSKPYQLGWLQALGFRVPETLLTTDPAEAEAFWELHGSVIYKSLSGTRSIVSRLGPDHRERMANVASCPTQFQRCIPGQDYRVHVVADQIFPAMIHSHAVDYRYGPVPFECTKCDLPDDVAALCVRAVAAMNLTLAGLDLRRTPEGEWFCFEVNPSPAFNYFDGPGMPIASAVAYLLANPPEGVDLQPSSTAASSRRSA